MWITGGVGSGSLWSVTWIAGGWDPDPGGGSGSRGGGIWIRGGRDLDPGGRDLDPGGVGSGSRGRGIWIPGEASNPTEIQNYHPPPERASADALLPSHDESH